MKKIRSIATIALGLGLLFALNVQAITPMLLNTESTIIKSDISTENEIEVQDWMFSFEDEPVISEKEVEKELILESWMIDGTWSFDINMAVSEPDIELEDWMYGNHRQEYSIIALGF